MTEREPELERDELEDQDAELLPERTVMSAIGTDPYQSPPIIPIDDPAA